MKDSSNHNSQDPNRKRRGQAMLLTLLALGGTLFGATTIAGMLVVYQIRQSGDAGNSAKAIFAADAGIEWGLYQFFKDGDAPRPEFQNDATFTLTCTPDESCASSSTAQIKSLGLTKNVARALELTLQQP
jgi:hypothetical protein